MREEAAERARRGAGVADGTLQRAASPLAPLRASAAGGALLRAARRADPAALTDPIVLRRIGALSAPPVPPRGSCWGHSMHLRLKPTTPLCPQEARAHADVTQYQLGVLPPARRAAPRGLSVTRAHADATSASAVPVPVSDYNCSSFEVRPSHPHSAPHLPRLARPAAVRGATPRRGIEGVLQLIPNP